MGFAYEMLNPVVYPVARELFEKGIWRHDVAARIYKKFSKDFNIPENETNTLNIDFIISSAEDDYLVSKQIIKEREQIDIIIHTHSWGMDTEENLKLDDITIKITNYFNKYDIQYKHIHRDLQRETVYEPTVEIKSKGLKKKEFFHIDNEIFLRFFRNIEKFDFKKMYNENGSGCDGWELETELSRKDGLLNYNKKIALFSPQQNKNKPETNLLLYWYDEIKSIEQCKKYLEKVEQKKNSNFKQTLRP